MNPIFQSYSNKTILITGATGLIGNNLVDAFMRMRNVNVIALSRTIEKLETEFKEYKNIPNFKMIAQDIAMPLKIEQPVDFIFHAAGSMEGGVIKNYPVDVIKANIIGAMNCLEFLKDQREKLGKTGRMILFSSVTIYANNANEDLTVTEEDTKVTENLEACGAPYSQSKRMIEVITTAYARQYGIDAVIGRLSTVYGPTRIMPDTAFYEFIRASMMGKNIVLNSNGLARRDNIYIDDAINGILTIGDKGASSDVYNISSCGDKCNYASVDEIANIIANISLKPITVQYRENKVMERKPGIKLDNRKLKKLGWDITISLEEGIRRTQQAICENYNK